jgi:lipopolysaccharide export system protein LptA
MNPVKPKKFTLIAPALWLSGALAWALSWPCQALPSDKNETIRGSADKLIVDQKNGVATYTGAVKIQQGSLLISAEQIIIHTNPDSSVKKMIATGTPARFQQQPEEALGVITASANKITYTPNKEHLLLVENASLEQDGAVMSGPTIDYDLIKEVMRAAGNSQSGKDRINIVIPPKKPDVNN